MSSARNHSLVPQSTSDTQYNVRDAALRGASLAFSKPPVKPKTKVNTYTGGENGALLAATKVGTPVKRDWTGGSSRTASRSGHSPTHAASKSNSSSSLRVSEEHCDRVPSPSNIAARLAAARHSPRPPISQALVAKPTMSERGAHEGDILPPTGSVGSVLATFEHKKPAEPRRKRRDSAGLQMAGTRATTAEASYKSTDETSIPPTTSLVKMFEQNQPSTPTNPPTAPLHITRNSPPPVRSPKPQRAFKLPPDPSAKPPLQSKAVQTPSATEKELKPQVQLTPAQFTDGAKDPAYFKTRKKDPLKSPPIKQKPVKLAAINTSNMPASMLLPQGSSQQMRPMSQESVRSAPVHRKMSTSIESSNTADSPVSFKSAKEQQELDEKPKPSLPPPRRSNTRKLDSVSATDQGKPTAPVPIKPRNQSQNSSAMRPPEHFSPPRRPLSSRGTSPSVYHNNYQRESVKEIAKHMTGESLSNAIMGAALAASSRNASPAPQPLSIEPLFPPRKQHHHHHLPFHRSPSPPKQSPPKTTGKMRTTMRQEPSSSDDEDKAHTYKKKGTRIMGIKQRKHPNKHHEGTRKRWRDQITERERKRYEGVWAANKGLYLSGAPSLPAPRSSEDDASLDVLNLLVKEIWTRSRLPDHVLEEVWDLVDGRGIGRLTRFEFVVGLWLIDQQLKGRKLPTKVSDSVWQSARGIGLKVKVYR